MEVTAKARHVKMAPRKIRLLVDLVRGMDVETARAQLRHVNKRAKTPVLKVIESAMANAEHNHRLQRQNLYIKVITADEGPVMKRWLPRAFGRATPLLKRSTHLAVVLAEKVPSQSAIKEPTKNIEKHQQIDATLAVKHALSPMTHETIDSSSKPVTHNHQPEPVDPRRLAGQEREGGNRDKRRLSAKKTIRKIFNRKSG